jgi:putative transposase
MTLSHSGTSELAQLMEGTTAGALIPEIVRRGFQDLLEAEVSALTGAQLHERCPDQRSTHRNGSRERVLTTQVGDLTLAIPRLSEATMAKIPEPEEALELTDGDSSAQPAVSTS